MKALTIIVAAVMAALALTGCSTFAIYQHPVTGVKMECETNSVAGTGWGGSFADCKTLLEEQGYRRVGTRHGDQRDPVSGKPQPAR